MPQAAYGFHILWILTLSDLSWEADVKVNTRLGTPGNRSRASTNANYSTKPTPAHSFPTRTIRTSPANKSTVGSATVSISKHLTTTEDSQRSDERNEELYGYWKKSYFDPGVWCSGQVGCANMHVMCQYPQPGPSENCHGYVEIPIKEPDILKIIHYFNYRRNLVAGGQEYKLPAASGMRMLEWDGTLAEFAQRWADQCIFDPNILRDVSLLSTLSDPCRDLPDFEVAQVSTKVHGFSTRTAQIDDVIHLLISTISSSFFNVTAHILFSGFVPGDDYGAVALHSHAHSIGCGISSYLLGLKTDDHRVTVFHCNVGPLSGMHLLDKYYTQGAPCSECPSGTSCQPDSYFQFLCQTEESMDDPKEIKHRSYHYSGSDIHHSSSLLPIMVATIFYLLI